MNSDVDIRHMPQGTDGIEDSFGIISSHQLWIASTELRFLVVKYIHPGFEFSTHFILDLTGTIFSVVGYVPVNYKTDFINLKICWVTLSEVLIIRIGLGCLYLNRCCGISSFESDALDCIYAMQYNPDFQEDRNPGVPISMFYMSCIFA